MARTDIRGIDGLEAAVDRAKALVDAGADAIFPEAMADLEEFAAIRAAVDVPILANMTEFGKSELFTLAAAGRRRRQHRDLPGVAAAARDGRRGARPRHDPRRRITHESQVPEMQTRARLYELVDYEGYSEFDDGIFTFDLKNNRS